MKLNSEKVKSRSLKKFSKTVKVSILLALVVIGVIGANLYTSYTIKQTVDVVKVNTSIPQDGRVTQDMFVKDSMLRAEYDKVGVHVLADGSKKRSIVLWEDRERIQNAYASYYIRQDTPLYWDSLSKETPKKYSYLYKMDGELLNIKMDGQDFGQMLVPGDKINVRATYSETDFRLPTDKEFAMQQQLGLQQQTTIQKNVMLFNSVTVLDILNNDGESIFDLYYQLLALPKSQQLATVATDEFKERVEPQEILLNVTPEEADRYMSITNSSPTYMMTLLPRTSGNLITEALNALQIGFARDGQ